MKKILGIGILGVLAFVGINAFGTADAAKNIQYIFRTIKNVRTKDFALLFDIDLELNNPTNSKLIFEKFYLEIAVPGQSAFAICNVINPNVINSGFNKYTLQFKTGNIALQLLNLMKIVTGQSDYTKVNIRGFVTVNNFRQKIDETINLKS